MNTIAFTICANNYLAHAKTLATSFKHHHANIPFSIVILDQPKDSIDYDNLGADQIVWPHELIPDLVNEKADVYSVAELCTVIKPKMYEYFYNNSFDKVLFIDPDVKVFSYFEEVLDKLEDYDMILTPHICSPTGEIGHPLDKDIMRTGIYNLGFLAMKKSEQTIAFTKWWHKRVVAYGFHDLSKGFFYDQIWFGFAPAFLDNIYILRHLGYNVANWNLHERKIMVSNDKYYINTENTPIRFFHYSHFKIENLPIISSYNENYNLENRPDIRLIFNEYVKDLENFNYHKLKNIDYIYGKKTNSEKVKKQSRLNRAYMYFKHSIKTLLFDI